MSGAFYGATGDFQFKGVLVRNQEFPAAFLEVSKSVDVVLGGLQGIWFTGFYRAGFMNDSKGVSGGLTGFQRFPRVPDKFHVVS